MHKLSSMPKLSFEQSLMLKDLVSSMSIRVCNGIRYIVSMKNRTSLVSNTTTMDSYAHRAIFNTTNALAINKTIATSKSTFATELIRDLGDNVFIYPELKESFWSPSLKDTVTQCADCVILGLTESNSVVLEMIHKVFQDTVYDNCVHQEVRNILMKIYENFLGTIGPFVDVFARLPIRLGPVEKSFNNRYHTTLSAARDIFNSMVSKDVLFNECFEIFEDYFKNRIIPGRTLVHWFSHHVLTVNNIKILMSPIFSGYQKMMSSQDIPGLQAVAHSSTVVDISANGCKDPSLVFGLRDIAHLKKRTFGKCLFAIKDIYMKNKGRVPDDMLWDIVKSESVPILDKIIQDRLAKKQKFNN